MDHLLALLPWLAGIKDSSEFLEREVHVIGRLAGLGSLLLVPVLLVVLAAWRARRRWVRGVLLALAPLLALPALATFAGAGYFIVLYQRPQPPPVSGHIFEGVCYTRRVRPHPPQVAHVIEIELDAPGIGFLVTPPEPQPGYETTARTAAEFLERHGLQLAINAAPFSPTDNSSPLRPYPRSGDPVDVQGYAASRGETYSSPVRSEGAPITIAIDADNQVRIGRELTDYQAVSGWELDPLRALERAGEPRLPRTAAALDRDRNVLILIVVDGYQPNYSVGATMAEVAEMLLELGGDSFINLDGGDSSTMVMAGQGGRARAVNSPINAGLLGRQSPVGNHLGIYARPLAAQP